MGWATTDFMMRLRRVHFASYFSHWIEIQWVYGQLTGTGTFPESFENIIFMARDRFVTDCFPAFC
jgi:hypothetical protein